jgi:hypothetical protein
MMYTVLELCNYSTIVFSGAASIACIYYGELSWIYADIASIDAGWVAAGPRNTARHVKDCHEGKGEKNTGCYCWGWEHI